MKVEAAKYNSFINLIKTLSSLASDIVIKDGVIRQPSDNRLFLIETNLTELFGEPISLNLPEAKVRCDMLSMFGQSDEPIIFEITDKWYYIYDKKSKLSMRAPDPAIMKLKPIDKQRLEDFVSKPLILSYILDPILVQRIKKATMLLGDINSYLTFKQKQNTAIMEIKTRNKSYNMDVVHMQLADNTLFRRDNLTVRFSLEPITLGDPTSNILSLYLLDNEKMGVSVKKTINDINVTIYQVFVYV